MRGVSIFGNTATSVAAGGLGLLLLLGGAGCVSEIGQGGSEDDVTEVTSALAGPNGHDYLFFTTPQTWASAKNTCQGRGYHLATIHDATENDWIFQQERNLGGGNWWLGYTDQTTEGLWSWDDFMGQGFVNWNAGEPNNQNNEDCLEHWSGYGVAKWNDSNCNNSFKYVCENGPTDSQPATFTYSATNTNNDTQNYAQFAVNLNAGQGLTIGTCGLTGSFGIFDTYLRVMKPNGTQLAENDNFCGGSNPPVLSQLSAGAPSLGTYVIRGGCHSTGMCSGTVAIVK